MKYNKDYNDIFLAQWLNGDLSDIDLVNLVSLDEYKSYLKIRKGLKVSEALDEDLEESYHKLRAKISKSSTKKTVPLYAKWFVGIAASLLLCFGILQIVNTNTNKMVIESNYGESKPISLQDGSEVLLNAKSSLSYNAKTWNENRIVELEGEAFFKVAKGHTFTVKTKNGLVEVLGTEFNVISYKDFFDVVCYEGKVKVILPNKKEHILTPNNAVRFLNDKEELFSVSMASPTWITGESTFKSVPLSVVVTMLEHQYNVKFDSSSIDDTILFSGGFPHNNIDIALQTVFKSLNINYAIQNKTNIKLGN